MKILATVILVLTVVLSCRSDTPPEPRAPESGQSGGTPPGAGIDRALSIGAMDSWDRGGFRTPDYVVPEPEARPQGFPVAGTVSHHLLAGAYMDDWFRRLADERDVGTFVILSPRHWGIGAETISLAAMQWHTLHGTVETDLELVSELAEVLDVQPENEVFFHEHGVDALIPYIGRYFPGAQVAAAAYDWQRPIDMAFAQRFARTVTPLFTGSEARDHFLVISVDFSHQGGRARTDANDARSRTFLENPASGAWSLVVSDNPLGINLLSGLYGLMEEPRLSILYHTDSLTLSGQDPEDITSYFFTVLTERSIPDRPVR